jgi:hypothetical protein
VQFLWTYLLGPLLAFLPKRWRNALGTGAVRWSRAALLSGLLESAGALALLGYWYSYGMQKYVSAGLDSAMTGKLGVVNDQQIGGVSLVVVATHPITWLLAFFAVEGAVRLCAAAFADNVVATMPLAIVDWGAKMFSAKDARPADALKRNAESFASTMKDRVLESRAKNIADEMHHLTQGHDEFLEIRASRKKEDWIVPKVIRVDDIYYRLEETRTTAGPRPFCYRLRKLPAGVPGRNVILYSTLQSK